MSQKIRNVEPSGTPVATVRVGESVRYADGSGETKEHTNWHSLSFDGKLADIALTLEKGDKRVRGWQDSAEAVHPA